MQQEIDLLERDLERLSQAIVYPQTPNLSRKVGQRLVTVPPVAGPRRPWALVGAAVALVVLAAAVALGSIPPARDAVADFFDRINIFQTTESPEGLPTEVTGTQVTLQEAEARLGQPLLLPAYPEMLTPSKVLFQDLGRVKTAIIFFRHPDGTPFALFVTNGRLGKGLPFGGTASATFVAGLGSEAYWLQGLRIVESYDLSGNVIPESVRATDVNTLVWSQEGFVYRLEGNLPQAEAVRIAQSLHRP